MYKRQLLEVVILNGLHLSISEMCIFFPVCIGIGFNSSLMTSVCAFKSASCISFASIALHISVGNPFGITFRVFKSLQLIRMSSCKSLLTRAEIVHFTPFACAFNCVMPEISMLWPVAVDSETELFFVIIRFSLFAILCAIIVMEHPVSGVPASLNECLPCDSQMRNGGDAALYTYSVC